MNIAALFDAVAAADTAAMVTAYEELYAGNSGLSDQDDRTYARCLIAVGRSEEAVELLRKEVDLPERVTSAFEYNQDLYWLGMAYQMLGKNDKAADCYQELLGYWDNADIQIEIIVDARERLARLRS